MRGVLAAAFLLCADALGKTLLGPRGVPWDENDPSLLVQPRQRPSPGGADGENVPLTGAHLTPLPSLARTASASEAYHYRFSYSDMPQTEAFFSWTSLDGSSPAEVQLGTESGKYVHLYSAETVTYAASDLCSSGSGYKDPGFCASPQWAALLRHRSGAMLLWLPGHCYSRNGAGLDT